jgi:hypothetical protein
MNTAEIEFTLFNGILLLANIGILGLSIKLYTEWFKARDVRPK